VYCFTSRSRIFHLHWDATITGEGQQNLGLCSALSAFAFEQGGIFKIAPHLVWHGASVYPVSTEGLPLSVASYDTQGVWRIYSNPDPHKSIPIQSSLTTHKGMWRIYSNPDPHKSIPIQSPLTTHKGVLMTYSYWPGPHRSAREHLCGS
jgi:hypothetical protein